jgi:hypothetical protein
MTYPPLCEVEAKKLYEAKIQWSFFLRKKPATSFAPVLVGKAYTNFWKIVFKFLGAHRLKALVRRPRLPPTAAGRIFGETVAARTKALPFKVIAGRKSFNVTCECIECVRRRITFP